MKYVRIVNVCLVISIIFFLLPEYGYGMQAHSGRVANPVTGAAVANAQVFVMRAGTMTKADIFADSQGKKPLANPVIADAGGRYCFSAPNGKYRLRILSPAAVLLYDHDDVSICDPREPRTILADETQPALSLNTMPIGGEINLPLMIEKLDENKNLVGARWRYETHNTEVGFGNFYNFRRRGGSPNSADLANIDSGSEPVLTWGTNDADDGIFTMPGFYISGGGLWLGDAHIVTCDLRLPVPQDDDPAGVVVFMNAPEGLVKGDVVALDREARLSVKPVSVRGEKLPFVVAKVDESGTFVMARGLAWVKVTGPVEPGDILVTSAQSLCAERGNDNSDPSCSLGVAVTAAADGKALVRISRVNGLPRQASGPEPGDGASNVIKTTDLSWQPGPDMMGQKVYFGTNYDEINDGSVSPIVTGDGALSTVSNTALGGPLEPLVTYYWKVDSTDASGSIPGTVWSFTTADVVNSTSSPVDASSEGWIPSYPPSHVIDGNLGTRWTSVPHALPLDPLASSLSEWIWINLGADRRLNSVSVDFQESAAVDYTIRLLTQEQAASLGLTDNGTAAGVSNWTTVATAEDLPNGLTSPTRRLPGTADVWDFSEGIAAIPDNSTGTATVNVLNPIGRYLLVDATEASDDFWGNLSIWEISVDSSLPGRSDFNKDWSIDFFDAAEFMGVWLSTDGNLPQDLLPDNKINLNDFALFAQDWLEE